MKEIATFATMKLPVTRLLAFLLISTLLSCAENDGKKDDNYQDILQSPAFAGITDSIRRFPENVELILSRASRLSHGNFHKAATADYKKAYEITGDADVALAYTSNLLLAGDVQQAIKILQEGNDKSPDNTEFNRRLAEIYLQKGDNMRAMQQYNEMLGKDSSNFEAWFEKGSLQLKMRDTTAALASLERSFTILPINHTAMALAGIYTARKDPRALEICDVILQRDTASTQTEPVFMKGVFYAETGNDQKAIEQFDECIRRDWKMTDAYIEKGIIYFERKEIDEALKVFNLAATVSNTDADVYFWMGRCYEQKGDNDQAITNYRRALALDESFVEAEEALKRLQG